MELTLAPGELLGSCGLSCCCKESKEFEAEDNHGCGQLIKFEECMEGCTGILGLGSGRPVYRGTQP